MTDTIVSHPTEAEMNSIRQIFERAANSIVQASELAKAVSELQAKFDVLTRDFETLLARNNELVTSLTEVRGQRDTAMAERDEAKSTIRDLEENVRHNNDVIIQQNGTIHDLQAKLEAMTKDRDATFNELIQMSTKADAATEKLHKIQHALGLPETPAPEPITERKPDAVAVPISESHDEPQAKVDPIESAVPKWDEPYDPSRF